MKKKIDPKPIEEISEIDLSEGWNDFMEEDSFLKPFTRPID